MAQGLRVMLLSGDRPEVVEALAREAGIPQADALSGVRPEQKVRCPAAALPGNPEFHVVKLPQLAWGC